ncbi:hypothetical protein IV203_006501 [Nitzschia inconspicua]|uniref:Uncharacterized protein n=1 Tax=Nitzschia inconspicua TaxID=303405 RepID=A0A9K3KAL9_9STRA|nr:hypothetical protein IV203_006631 [Nitzschia inconspicua]KAG7340097.1 hypothetical protein IV203_006501 [Nitzschia inconspicua]
MSSPVVARSLGSPSEAKQPQVYQIDFTAVASGKRFASTKRRVRWRFGFANAEALAAGQTGTDCRGEEHDVTIVWSITSGKRLVLADGQEVHYSNSRNTVFEFSWTMRGNHVLKVVAHASPPLSAQPGFRQYDFFVDGQSFFTFPKVFRLGLAANDPRGVSSSARSPPNMADRSRSVNPNGYPYRTEERTSVRSFGSTNNIAAIEAPHNPDEEEAYLQEAIKNSLKETSSPAVNRPAITNGAASVTSGGADSLLLDFMTAPPSTAPALPPSTSSYASDFYGAPPVSQQPAYAALPPSTTSMAPPTQANGYGNAAPDPWGASAYGAPSPASQQQPSNPYGAPAPLATLSYGTQPQTTTTTAPLAQDPFGAGSYAAAAPQLATPQGANFGHNSFSSPPPTSIAAPNQEYTPATQASSIGFASPVAQPYGAQQQQMNGFDQQQEQQQQQQPPQEQYGMNGDDYGFNGYGGPLTGTSDAAQVGFPEDSPYAPKSTPAPVSTDPALFSMNVLSGTDQPLVSDTMKDSNGTAAGGSLADQAYAKLVNMDAFDLVQDKGVQSRNNPFESASTSKNSSSLADMIKTKNSKPAEKKEIMRSYDAAPGAMVLSINQQGNFGGYGGQYGLGGMGMSQQQQQQKPSVMGGMSVMPPSAPMQGYGEAQQQPLYGQPPAPAQPYGQPLGYGMLAPTTTPQPFGMQQQPYGQPPPMQQQQPYGQPPPMQQQPFGF